MHRKYDQTGTDQGERLFFSLISLIKLPEIYTFLYVFLKSIGYSILHSYQIYKLNSIYTPAQDGSGLTCTKLLDEMCLEAGIREDDGTFQLLLLRSRVRKLDGGNLPHTKKMLQDWFQPCQNTTSYLTLIF